MASPVRFAVLGPLVATGAAGPIDLRGPRHRAVLARLLVANGRVVPVDRLIDDLWDSPPPNATGALHTFIAALRRALEPDRPPRGPAHLLVTTTPGYALHPTPDAVDTHVFTTTITNLPTDPSSTARSARTSADPLAAGRSARMSAGPLAAGRSARMGGSAARAGAAEALVAVEEALALWRGPAYAEFADQPWARAEVARLDELRLLAVERRAAALLALGRAADAVPDLRAHTGAHPWREDAWRLLALAQYRSARQADALDTLRRARRTLADTLGVDPDPALTQLESDILHHSPALLLPTTPAPRTGPAGTVHQRAGSPAGTEKFVGRVAELAAVATAADGVAGRGRSALVLISGEAGAGKTALAEAAAGQLASAGWTVAWGNNPDSEGTPAGWAWSRVLGTLASTDPGPETGTGTDGGDGDGTDSGDGGSIVDGPVAGGGDPVVARFRWQRAVGAYLGRVAARGPLLVVLDDLHWAGEETLALLAALVTDPVPGPVLLVGTYRGTDVPPALGELLGRVARTEPVRVQLGGLPAREVAELAGATTGRDIDPAAAEVIHRRSAGNPFFVRELARLLDTDGPAALAAVPPGVRDVVRYRMTRLPDGVQAILRHAAVLGTTVDLDLLAAITTDTPPPPATGPGDALPVLDAAETGARHGFLVERGPRRFDFAHALVRDTIYRDIPPSRRAAAHAATARTLESRHPHDIDALAHHYLLADDPAAASTAARYAAEAARRAERRAAPHEAARLWRSALTALDRATPSSPSPVLTTAPEPTPTGPASTTSGATVGGGTAAAGGVRERLGMVMGLVRASAVAGDLAGARELRVEALELAGEVGDPGLVAEAVGAFEVPASWPDSDDPALARRIAELAEVTLAGLPDGRHADRVRLLATIALELRNTGGDRAREAARQAEELARRLGEPGLLALALNARFMQLFDRAGLAPERAEVGAELVELGARHRLVTFEVLGHLILVGSAAAVGDLATADRHATAADALGGTYQLPLVGVLTQWYRALRTAVTDGPAAAEAAYRTAAARLPGTGMSGLAAGLLPLALLCLRLRHGLPLDDLRDADFGPHEPWCRPLLLLSTGDRTAATRAAAAIPASPHDLLFELRTCLHARTALALDDRTTLPRLYGALLPAAGELAGAATALVTLDPVARYLSDLATALGDPARSRAHAHDARSITARTNP